jgi:hypothetical protein
MNTLLAVLTGGGLAALGGLGSGWLNNWLGSRRDEQAHAHEQQMAREARWQDRLERTYTELGIYLSHYADWAGSVQPMLGPVPAPDPMPPAEQWRIETLVMNHGSPMVRQLLERWREQAQKIENADIVIKMAERARDPGSLDDEALRERQALDEYRKAMHAADEAIRSQMSDELAGPETRHREVPGPG